jgi:hypothetical protein
MGMIFESKIYADLPWCLIAGQRSCALVLDAYAYAEGRRRGLPGMAKKPCFSPGSHTSCPKLTLSDKDTICSRRRGEGGGGGGGVGEAH